MRLSLVRIARKGEYRLFKIRDSNGAHEVRGLEEVLTRRFKHTEWVYPAVIVVDGNEVQRSTAQKVLKKLKIRTPVVAVVKNERHRPKKILGHLKDSKVTEKDILLANSEVHRFAINFQRRQRRILK